MTRVSASRNRRKAAGLLPDGEGSPVIEVTEEPDHVIERSAAIDVAKDSGMVCLRVPSPDTPGARLQQIWCTSARFNSINKTMARLKEAGVERLALESTGDYWRIWYYLGEAAGLDVWLVNAREFKHLPGRPKTDRQDCVWLCKLNERGMLRRSFVPAEILRDLRALTRLRARLSAEQASHQARVEKVLEDALIKVSAVISKLFSVSGRAFLNALVEGERDPARLAALGHRNLKATQAELQEALTGRFRDVHALEISVLCTLIDQIHDRVQRLDAEIAAIVPNIPRVPAFCRGCGEIDSHMPGCTGQDWPQLTLIERLCLIPGISIEAARVAIAELGTDPDTFPTPGHAASWVKVASRTMQSGVTITNGPTGKGNAYMRAMLGRAVMANARSNNYLGARYRRIARRRGKGRGIVAVARTILELIWRTIADPSFTYLELGGDYYLTLDAERKTRDKIRELERLNPGMHVTLTPVAPPPETLAPATA